MPENIWLCAIYGKVARFHELARAAVPIQPTGAVSINGPFLIELLFGDSYAAFAERAVRTERFVSMLVPDAATNVDTFDTLAQSFLGAAYSRVIEEGETPKDPPDFYGIRAPASESTNGWPVYFFAVGRGLKLPEEAHRGKVALPSRSRPNAARKSVGSRLPWRRK